MQDFVVCVIEILGNGIWIDEESMYIAALVFVNDTAESHRDTRLEFCGQHIIYIYI